MLLRHDPDRMTIAFDDHRMVANAGLILPVTFASHLGFGELVDNHVNPGDAPGQPNARDKLLTLVASALAGGDHQGPAAALLLPGRTAHPQSAPSHFASPPRLALAKPVQPSSRQTARPATPFLTAPTASAGSPHDPIAGRISPSASTDRCNLPLGVATTPCAQLDWRGSRPPRLYPARLSPSLLKVG